MLSSAPWTDAKDAAERCAKSRVRTTTRSRFGIVRAAARPRRQKRFERLDLSAKLIDGLLETGSRFFSHTAA